MFGVAKVCAPDARPSDPVKDKFGLDAVPGVVPEVVPGISDGFGTPVPGMGVGQGQLGQAAGVTSAAATGGAAAAVTEARPVGHHARSHRAMAFAAVNTLRLR